MIIELLTPVVDAAISLLTPMQRTFLSPEEDAKRAALDGALNFRWYDLKKGENEQSIPAPLQVSFRAIPETENEKTDGYAIVIVSEHEDLSDPVVLEMTEGNTCDIYNLNIGRTYYVCVQKEGKRSEVRRFTTLFEMPRGIFIEGISNVRDAGGYACDGGRVRTGVLYRGGEVERHMHITPRGVRAMQALGIRTDLDLRGEAVGTVDYPALPPFGIRRVLIPMKPYGEVIAPENAETLCEIFHLLADPEAYPLYHHCWGGADRGGSLAFLIGAVLGVSMEDLLLDYEFTSLSIWNIRSRNYPEFLKLKTALLEAEGESISEKAKKLLTSRGVPEADIASIRSILIEKQA